jgi:hypothetical protein
MRKKLTVSRGQDPFTAFGKWFLANSHTRTISPFSKVTVAEYIDRCIARGEENWLEDAEALAAGDEALMAKVAAKRARP